MLGLCPLAILDFTGGDMLSGKIDAELSGSRQFEYNYVNLLINYAADLEVCLLPGDLAAILDPL
jgi:hypothetical protein